MRLEVKKVQGMPFVKVPLGHILTLYPCNAILVEGRFGPSLAISMDRSDPEIRLQMEDMQDKIHAKIYQVKEKIEQMLRTHYEHEEIGAVRLIKGSTVWAKCPKRLFPKGNGKASVKLWFHHIFFSESRISVSIEAR